MNSSSFIRYGGIAALASAALYVASMGLWMSAGTAGSPPLASAMYAVSQLIFLVALYALYLIHRNESATLFLIGALTLTVSILVSLFIDPTDTSNPVVLFLAICYGIGGLILGWLAYRSPKLNKGIGLAALLTGALSLVMVPFIVAGSSAELIGLLNLILTVPYLVWLVWLGIHFLQGKAAIA